jgi:hypothetical protein
MTNALVTSNKAQESPSLGLKKTSDVAFAAVNVEAPYFTSSRMNFTWGCPPPLIVAPRSISET